MSAVEHLASTHALATVTVSNFEHVPQLQSGLLTLADTPLPGGSLRIHALYGVWRI